MDYLMQRKYQEMNDPDFYSDEEKAELLVISAEERLLHQAIDKCYHRKLEIVKSALTRRVGLPPGSSDSELNDRLCTIRDNCI
jgi:hypothetical protein